MTASTAATLVVAMGADATDSDRRAALAYVRSTCDHDCEPTRFGNDLAWCGSCGQQLDAEVALR